MMTAGCETATIGTITTRCENDSGAEVLPAEPGTAFFAATAANPFKKGFDIFLDVENLQVLPAALDKVKAKPVP